MNDSPHLTELLNRSLDVDQAILAANAAHFRWLIGNDLAVIPDCLQDVGESLSAWPFDRKTFLKERAKQDVDDYDPDWTNDDRYNDPRTGQAKWINGR